MTAVSIATTSVLDFEIPVLVVDDRRLGAHTAVANDRDLVATNRVEGSSAPDLGVTSASLFAAPGAPKSDSRGAGEGVREGA